jgi:phospholipid/cholesterol/gamma-HCH transport system substrate-binding protein
MSFSQENRETDEMLRTLSTTNSNIEKISGNLYEISTKLNSSESLWMLLSDTVISQNLKRAVADLRAAGRNTADLTGTARDLAKRLEAGNGIAYTLFTDTTFSNKLTSSVNQIQHASNDASAAVADLKSVIDNIKRGEGTAGLILTDTAPESLFNSAENIEQGTARFNKIWKL